MKTWKPAKQPAAWITDDMEYRITACDVRDGYRYALWQWGQGFIGSYRTPEAAREAAE